MRAALVHYWLLNMRGGEKVVEALCRLLPDADIFTLFYDPARVSDTIRSHRVEASFLQPARRFYRSLLPFMPMALESFDLRGYDLVISSESGPAKGVILPSTTRHLCYVHTPMRYAWDLYPAYRNEWTRSRWKRAAMTPLSNYVRLWDYASAARVDQFIANSANVQRRIWKTYRRESTIVSPPVAVECFYTKPPGDYYLIVSELVAYKRVDCAVRAFAKSGRKLRIVGKGPEYRALRRIATPNVEFCGPVGDPELRELYARARAFLLPGEEDFGIAAVEAMASGKPVIGLARGAALDTVPVGDPLGGILYPEASSESLAAAVEQWDQRESAFDAQALRAYAVRFSETNFAARMRAIIAETGVAEM